MDASVRKKISKISEQVAALSRLGMADRVDALNQIRQAISSASPFYTEPVDCVIWVKADSVQANDYNPNSVAPPEMELLRHSIMQDGYTQPVVTWPIAEGREVVDGFHRTRVCKELEDVRNRVHGYLPVVTIRQGQSEKNDRIASTIRHNRARGKHRVESMSDIVIELKKRNWSDKRIGKELGMDEDEVLRLCQVSGLSEVFQNTEFSKSWEVGIFDQGLDHITEADIKDEPVDDNRILHTWDKWECYPAGFYENHAPDGMTDDDCEKTYKELLSDIPLFEKCMAGVLRDWPKSCEHYLSNEKMNRIAWLGQASLCWKHKIPSRFRGGYNLLSEDQQKAADLAALGYLNKWLKANGRPELDLASATSKTEANLY